MFLLFIRKHKFISLLILLNATFGIYYGGRYISHHVASRADRMKPVLASASKFRNMMPEEQYIKMYEICYRTDDNGGKMEASDISYMFGILHHKYSSPQEYRRRSNEKMIVGTLTQSAIKSATPAQENMIFDEFLSDMVHPLHGIDPAVEHSGVATPALVTSCGILTNLHDSRINPYLVSMTQSDNQTLRRLGSQCLRQLGIKTVGKN